MASTPTRVALIGPVIPFRGGIAQHTTMLARALARDCEVRSYSFARQYPAWLFPGESDRDPAFEGHAEPGATYDLDSVNPATWRSVLRQIVAWKPAVVVMPWWTVYFAPLYSYMTRRLRAAGIPVVFVSHNVVEHETAAWKRAATRGVLSRGSAHVVHTSADAENLSRMLPGARCVMHPLPVFDTFPPALGSLAREHDLELLFFGFVRPYKGLDVLLEAMALTDPDIDVRLSVVGEFWHGSGDTREQITRLGLEERVEIVEGYVSDAAAAEYFDRADAVVLPYRSATGSAVVAVAYHYDKPVIATDVGGFPDVVVEGTTGFLVPAESPAGLARAIERVHRADRAAMAREISRFKSERLSWSGFAAAVLDAARLGGASL